MGIMERRFRVNIHTVDGWVEYGRYATLRGAQQAQANAHKRLDYMPLCARVGGTDNTYAVIDDVPADYRSLGYFETWCGVHKHGCAPARWTFR